MRMKDIVTILCKTLSIITFIKSISYITSFLAFFIQDSSIQSQMSAVYFLVQPAIFLLISILLWIFADKIAELMVKDETRIDKVLNFNLAEFKIFAYSFLGLIILSQAVPEIVRVLFNLIKDMQKNQGFYEINTFDLGRLIQYTLKSIVGFVLLVGPKKVLSSIKATRTAGVITSSGEVKPDES